MAQLTTPGGAKVATSLWRWPGCPFRRFGFASLCLSASCRCVVRYCPRAHRPRLPDQTSPAQLRQHLLSMSRQSSGQDRRRCRLVMTPMARLQSIHHRKDPELGESARGGSLKHISIPGSQRPVMARYPLPPSFLACLLDYC